MFRDAAFAKIIGQQRGGRIVDVPLVELEPYPVVRVERLAQPLINDDDEIVVIERAHRLAAQRPSGIARTGHIAKEALGKASVLVAIGHRVIERQIVPDARIIMGWIGLVGIDPLDEGGRDVGHPTAGHAGFAIKDPVVFELAGFG